MLSRQVRLDDLLGNAEPHASFHDASLLALNIDYLGRSLIAEFDIWVGNPDADEHIARERRHRGRLCLSGLILWACDPPSVTEIHGGAPWLTSDGLLAEAPTEEGKRLASALGADGVAWYLYFNDLNAFAYCIAQDARFEWL